MFWCSNALKDGFKLRSLLYKFVLAILMITITKRLKSSMQINPLHIKLQYVFCCICSI